jgi:hypothetical protein
MHVKHFSVWLILGATPPWARDPEPAPEITAADFNLLLTVIKPQRGKTRQFQGL